MGRTKRFISGVSLGYVSQLLVTLTGLWLTPFLLGHIGQHDYGLWLVGTQVMAYLALLDFGVVALLPRETAFAKGHAGAGSDAGTLPLLVGQTARLVLWQTPLVAVVAVALYFMLPAQWEALRQPFAVVLAAFVLMFPLRIFQAVLQGLQDLTFLAQAQMCTWAAGLALTVALVLSGAGLYALAVGWVATQTVAMLALIFRLRRRFPGAWPVAGLPRLPWKAARRKLASGFWVSVTQVGVVLLYATDVLVIGKLLGPSAVVPYVCTVKLPTVLANQPQMLAQAAIPALSELRAAGERERLRRVCVALSQAMLVLSGAVVCVVLAVNRGFVGWWVGAEQFGGLLLTALVLLNMILRHLNMTAGCFLFSFGYERRLALTGLADGLVTVVATAALANAFGLVGAAAGSILGLCLVSLPANLSALAGAGAVPAGGLLRSLAPWFWRFAALSAASGLLARAFVPRSFPELAATALVVAAVYTAVMLPVVLREPLGTYVRSRLPSFSQRFVRRSA